MSKTTGPPQPPIDIGADCSEREKATVSWRPQFQGGSAQTFFIQTKSNDTWITLRQNISDDGKGGLIFLVVDNLKVNQQHRFRVGSVNDEAIEVFSGTTNCTILGKLL